MSIRYKYVFMNICRARVILLYSIRIYCVSVWDETIITYIVTPIFIGTLLQRASVLTRFNVDVDSFWCWLVSVWTRFGVDSFRYGLVLVLTRFDVDLYRRLLAAVGFDKARLEV